MMQLNLNSALTVLAFYFLVSCLSWPLDPFVTCRVVYRVTGGRKAVEEPLAYMIVCGDSPSELEYRCPGKKRLTWNVWVFLFFLNKCKDSSVFSLKRLVSKDKSSMLF